MPAHQSVLRGHDNTNKAFLGIKLGARKAAQWKPMECVNEGCEHGMIKT